MFRDPMASRKPQGILASSAPMMTAAQRAMVKNEPIKAQDGTSVNTNRGMFSSAFAYPGDVGSALEQIPKPGPGASYLERFGDLLGRGAFVAARAPYDVGAQIYQGARYLTDPVAEYLTAPRYTEAETEQQQVLDAAAAMKDYEQQSPAFRKALTPPSSEVVLTEGEFTDSAVETGDPTATLDKTETAPVITNDILKQLDPQSGLTTEERNIRYQSLGQDLVVGGQQIIDSDLSPKQKATDFDKLFGIEGTYEDRVTKRKEFLKNLLGERAKDVRTDANYNLMMTGLLIAAGESPEAMTNIAKGAASGLAGYGEALGREGEAARKEETAVALQAVSEISEEDRQVRALKAQEAMTMASENRAELAEIRKEGRLETMSIRAEDRAAIADKLKRSFDRQTLIMVEQLKGELDKKTPLELAVDLVSSPLAMYDPNLQKIIAEDGLMGAVNSASTLFMLDGDVGFASMEEAEKALAAMDPANRPATVVVNGQMYNVNPS